VNDPAPAPAPVLLAVSVVPVWPVENGFALRAHTLLSELSQRWNVVLAAPMPGTAPEDFAHMRHLEPLPISSRWAHLPANHDPRRSSGIVRALVRRWQPSAALFLHGAEHLAFGMPELPPSVSDHVDCLTLAAAESLGRRRRFRTRVAALRDVWQAARFERAVVRRMSCTIAAGERDAAALRRLGGRRTVVMIPNGVDPAPTSCWSARAREPTVIFTGILDYGPNTDAACFLARRVWPLVHDIRPDARLRIAGRRPPAAVRDLGSPPFVTVHADVEDMRAALQHAWLAVAPMRLGSGVKNKVLEAWGAGRAVVMTPRAVNGLPLPPGHADLVAASATDLAARIVELLDDPSRLKCLGETAHAFARAHLTWPLMAGRVSEVLAMAATTPK
jgi:glycosyltransferase involved in cell wall biosynthesis